jgi:hypothetical protein
MTIMINKYLVLPVLCIGALLFRCTIAPLAGGSDNPDFIVMGSVVDSCGQGAPNAVVTIFPALYNPVIDTAPAAAMIDTTGAGGVYRLAVKQKGAYTVQAVHLLQRTRLLVSGISVAGDTTRVAEAPLTPAGAVKVSLPPAGINGVTGYIYVPGTMLCTFLNNRIDSVVLDSVPAGTLPILSYAATGTTGSTVLRYDVPVASGDTSVVRNTAWKYCRRIILNTAKTGAGVNSDVANFPVLIRLGSDVFDFSQAMPGGADLRFSKRNNTLLAYEIEQWDETQRRAAVWVKADTVYGNDSLQSIMMYWGNPEAVARSNPAAVFDTAAGFAGVWHLGQTAGAPVSDATANGFNGTASATIAVSGAAGNAQWFDGTSSVIRVAEPATSKLNFPSNGSYTVSAWVNAASVDSLYRGIVYKSNFEYGLQIRPESTWEFFTFINGTGWEGSRTPVTVNSWHFIIGVRQGNKQYLYVDGVCVDSTKVVVASNLSRVYDSPLEIGHCPDGGLEPERYFFGAIDEVRIAGVANGADWITLCYMNQKEQDALVKW